MIKFGLMLCFMALVAQATSSTWGLVLGWFIWQVAFYLAPHYLCHFYRRRH